MEVKKQLSCCKNYRPFEDKQNKENQTENVSMNSIIINFTRPLNCVPLPIVSNFNRKKGNLYTVRAKNQLAENFLSIKSS